MSTFDMVANVILIASPRHAETIFEQVVSGADADAGCMAGISRLPNEMGLVYKVLGFGDRACQGEGARVLGSGAAGSDRRAGVGVGVQDMGITDLAALTMRQAWAPEKLRSVSH
jgi:hypothetical protein